MLGGGLESLIPKKNNQGDDQVTFSIEEEEIEFRLPDIGGGLVGSQPKEEPAPAVAPERDQPKHVFQIEVEKIKPNPQQPRRVFNEEALRELAGSIREFGIIQPLVVSKIERETDTGSVVEYELIAGERRLKAAKMLDLPTVPVVIRQADRDVDKLELAIIENIQRADLNPIESARAMARLQDEFGLTQREIATRLGKSRAVVANSVRLLSLPTEIQEAIADGTISESHGRLMLSLEDQAMQLAAFSDLKDQNLTVRDLERRIKRVSGGSKSTEDSTISRDPEVEALREQLEELLGTKVDVKREGKSGKIIINFYSQEELNAVLSKLFRQNDSQSL